MSIIVGVCAKALSDPKQMKLPQATRNTNSFAYGKWVWSFLLTVETWFGLFTYGGRSVWSFFTYDFPRPEIGFSLFLLMVLPPQVKKTNRK